MAEYAIIDKDIPQTDTFMNMPKTAQLLYFYLGIYADADGVVSMPKAIMRMIGASDTDLTTLVTNLFIARENDQLIVVGCGGFKDG